MKVRLFNVKFSPNLGDGLLSQCLEKALVDLGADPDTWSVDLAARKAYGDVLGGRTQIMAALDLLPGPVRREVIRAPLALHAARSWRPHYAHGLADADCVVIGGGNLISDIDLNFPTKLTLAMEEAEKRKLPVVVYASGVTSGWTPRGTEMLRRAFAKPILKGVFVRDADSAALWDAALAETSGHRAQVVRDPGLLAAEWSPQPPRPAGERTVVGLGVMSHIAIRYHADNAPPAASLDRWYVDVARGLIDAGCQVRVFTNGSPEDKIYAAKLRPALTALGGEERLTFLEQRTPAELCAHIAAFDALIAFRMHAIIAAYSYGVPSVGLAWDRKLQSFMASVGRERFFRNLATFSAIDCVATTIKAAQEGISETERLAVLDEARHGVAQLYAVLRASL